MGMCTCVYMCVHVCVLPAVRFLDVNSAITTLAMTAGLQFTLNLQQWAPAAAGCRPQQSPSTPQERG